MLCRPSSGTCCRIVTRAETKPTDANFVRVIRKKVQSIKVVTNEPIGTCSSYLYILYTASRGSIWCSGTSLVRGGWLEIVSTCKKAMICRPVAGRPSPVPTGCSDNFFKPRGPELGHSIFHCIILLSSSDAHVTFL